MSEYIIIGGDKKEYGPVSVSEVGEWIRGGRANGDSQIKRVGAEEWERLRDFPELSSYLSPATPPSGLPPQPSSQQPNYPGVGPEHAWLKDTGRATYVSATDSEALKAFRLLCNTEGIIPALETAHAIAYVNTTLAPALAADQVIIICLSGRGDKDLQTVMEEEK